MTLAYLCSAILGNTKVIVNIKLNRAVVLLFGAFGNIWAMGVVIAFVYGCHEYHGQRMAWAGGTGLVYCSIFFNDVS